MGFILPKYTICSVYMVSVIFYFILQPEEGEVFIWDVRSRKCLHKFEDEGSLEGKCIAVSKNNQYVACG